MYTVMMDGYTIHDLRADGLALESPVLVQEDNLAASFKFTIRPSHPRYLFLRRLSSVVEVFRDGVRLFRGRPIKDDRGWENEKEVLCEGELAFLNDSVQRPYRFNGSVEEYLTLLIDTHNGQMPAEKQFALRDVTVTDPNDYITRASSDYPSVFRELQDKLVKLLGGHIVLERVGGVTYMDYLDDIPYESLQTIEFGVNLLDFSEAVRADEIAT
ncbi:MAG: hypothetical protein LBS85_02870, partial [Clostridiales Family XIII bacterium]|nr:hypothetical protein [Clostridiales Family XIII bacterium]